MTQLPMVRRASISGVMMLFAASGLSAQDPQTPGQSPEAQMGMGQMMQMMGEGMMGSGMMQMMGQGMGMMPSGGPSPAMILRMGEALDLTDQQRTELEAIQEQYSESAQPHMTGMMEAHRSARAALESDPPDIDAYEEALREGADRMVQAHVAMARAAAEARDVLTDVQRQELQEGMQMMRGMMMGQGQPGGMMGRGTPR